MTDILAGIEIIYIKGIMSTAEVLKNSKPQAVDLSPLSPQKELLGTKVVDLNGKK